MNEKEANAEMERLVYYSKPQRTQIYDYKNEPYSQSNPFSVQAGPGKIVRGDLKRLPQARSYGAGETVANNLENGAVGVIFPNVSRFPSGGSGVILGGKLTKNNTSILNVSFRIWLYQVRFPLNVADSDGEPLQIRYARRDDRIGYLDFDTFVGGFNCAESQAFVGVSQSLLFGMPQGSNTMFGLVQTRSPYEAIAGEEFSFYLHIASD